MRRNVLSYEKGDVEAAIPGTAPQRATVNWFVITVFIMLQVADVLTTNRALSVPGNREANPIIVLLKSHFGSAWWWAPKTAITLVGVLVTCQLEWKWPIVVVISYYIFIVTGNLFCL